VNVVLMLMVFYAMILSRTSKRTHRRGESAAPQTPINELIMNKTNENKAAPSVDVPRLVRLLDSEASRAESETSKLVDTDGYNEMRAVVQTLRWMQSPGSVRPPVDMVLDRLKGIPGGSEDCLADPHLEQS